LGASSALSSGVFDLEPFLPLGLFERADFESFPFLAVDFGDFLAAAFK
jgi:hypothetical protein